jgi:hypothetical protein
MASIHETAESLHAVGVMDKRTMREIRRDVPDAGPPTEAEKRSARSVCGKAPVRPFSPAI